MSLESRRNPVRPHEKVYSPSTRRPEISHGFDYASHTQEVKGRLQRWNMGEAMQMIDVQGLNNEYIPWAREKLFGTRYTYGFPQEGLPQYIGETVIPDAVRQKMQNAYFVNMSFNAGYGHLRPARLFSHTAKLLGAHTDDHFIGGPEDVFKPAEIVIGGKHIGFNINELFRTGTRGYTRSSIKTAIAQGMLSPDFSYLAKEKDPHPGYEKLMNGIIFLRNPKGTLQDTVAKRSFTKAMDKAIRMVYNPKDVDKPEDLPKQSKRLYAAFGRVMRKFLYDKHFKSPEREMFVVSTYPLVSSIISEIQKRQTKPHHARFFGANFTPDSQQPLISYVNGQLNLVESPAIAKWNKRLGNHPNADLADVFDSGGTITPASVFLRDSLNKTRQEALQRGEPLTVVGLASGVAPVQLESFRNFMNDAKQELLDGKIRMVIQCGAQEGKGLLVYEQLKKTAEELGITKHVVLHVAPTPEAALDFFEALSWSEKPIALYVKAAEVARMAHSLEIPVIATGIVGDHELSNYLSTLSDDPSLLYFPPQVGEQFAKDAIRILPNDPLGEHMIEEDPHYLTTVLERIQNQTGASLADTIAMAKNRILHLSNPTEEERRDKSAMLSMIAEMMKRKEALDKGRNEKKYPSRRGR